MKKTASGSTSYAYSALACGIEFVAAYPITPTTKVIEKLSEFYADSQLKKFIAVESEFSALSALIGATASGTRSFTSTGGQGLLLMHELLHSAAGMRLPIVMLVGNRAVNSPLNIWNDHQDAMSQRDTGWIQLYARSSQEAVDLIPIAFYAAEKINIPAMVCVDGFFLTHAVEEVDIPEAEKVKKFLPPFNYPLKLDSSNPLSLGVYAEPKFYQLFRQDLSKDLHESIEVIEEAGENFARIFGRDYSTTEEFFCRDAERIIVGLGCMMQNAIYAAKELRKKKEKVGVLYIRSFRPFPRKKLRKILEGKKIAVIDRALSLGSQAPLYMEVAEALHGTNAVVSSFYGALGGRGITRKGFEKIFFDLNKKEASREWIGNEGYEGVEIK